MKLRVPERADWEEFFPRCGPLPVLPGGEFRCGRGFNLAQGGEERNGLFNMTVSRPGEGYQISFDVPLKYESFLNSLFRSRCHNGFAAKFSGDQQNVLPAATKAVELSL